MRVSVYRVRWSEEKPSEVILNSVSCQIPGLIFSVINSTVVNGESPFLGTIVIDDSFNTLQHKVQCYVARHDMTENLAWIVCVSEHGYPDDLEVTAHVDANREVLDRVWQERSLIRRIVEWMN